MTPAQITYWEGVMVVEAGIQNKRKSTFTGR